MFSRKHFLYETMEIKEQIVENWGLQKVTSLVAKPQDYLQLESVVATAQKQKLKVCAAGGRMSFSNVCLLSKNYSIDTSLLNKIIEINTQEHFIIAQAGLKEIELLQQILPLGFIVAGLTGSTGNTIGGNIGNDVNGKDSWHRGNFGANVLALKLMLANGSIIDIEKGKDDALLNAVIGGMGLLGIILEVKLKLLPIAGMQCKTSTEKLKNVEHLFDYMSNLSPIQNQYAYCWTDPFATNENTGKGLCETAILQASENIVEAPIQPQKTIAGLPPKLFWKLFRLTETKWSFRLANYFKYQLASNKTAATSFWNFQYPMLKFFPNWNFKFAPNGFQEWQIFFPTEKFIQSYKKILAVCRKHNQVPFLCAVRKHKPQSGYLSFAGDGFSLTINYDLNRKFNVQSFEKELTDIVLENFGKVYLGKYPYFSEEALQTMYPEWKLFCEIKQQYDPDFLFTSDAFSWKF